MKGDKEMTITTVTNGFVADRIQKMLEVFEKAAEKLFPECEVEHFFYGDKISMTDLRLASGHYAHFTISENRVGLSGYTCSYEELKAFESLTYRDELYNGKLMQLFYPN